jgi:hypothetical protein
VHFDSQRGRSSGKGGGQSVAQFAHLFQVTWNSFDGSCDCIPTSRTDVVRPHSRTLHFEARYRPMIVASLEPQSNCHTHGTETGTLEGNRSAETRKQISRDQETDHRRCVNTSVTAKTFLNSEGSTPQEPSGGRRGRNVEGEKGEGGGTRMSLSILSIVVYFVYYSCITPPVDGRRKNIIVY